MVEYPDIAYFLSKDLISKSSRDEIYEKIAMTASEFLECDTVSIFMLSEETEKISCVKFYNGTRFVKKEMDIGLGEGLIGSVVENGEYLSSKNLRDDLSEAYFSLEREFSEMSSMLSMPIFAGSLVIGALNVYTVNPYEFSEEEIKIGKFIAMMGGVFIYSLTLYENANMLYLRQKEESKKTSDLLEISRLVSSSLDISSIIDYAADRLMKITKTDKALVYLKDNEKSKFCYEYFGCNVAGCSILGGNINCYNIAGFKCQFMDCPSEPRSMSKCSECSFLNSSVLKLFKGYNINTGENDLLSAVELDSCQCLKGFSSSGPIIRKCPVNIFDDAGKSCKCGFKEIEKEILVAIPIKTDNNFMGFIFLFGMEKVNYSNDTIDFVTNISNIISVAVHNALTLTQIEDEHFETINSISEAIEARDTYTRTHGDRLIEYGALVAKEIGLGEAEIKNIRYAAVMHDVGKIGIKDSILNKTGKLTVEEYEEIKKHPEIGYNMLKKIKFLSHIAKDVLHHQERFDGKGYPNGVAGEDIPIASRIIAVIDTFDAMTTDRPYRRALPIKDALEELRKNSGTQFDPKVVEAFLKVVKK